MPKLAVTDIDHSSEVGVAALHWARLSLPHQTGLGFRPSFCVNSVGHRPLKQVDRVEATNSKRRNLLSKCAFVKTIA
jgi:hypothetical protein